LHLVGFLFIFEQPLH